ncbi:helix-turn-helix domain-containing protein [Clostridioides difficile]|uniref:helix-turn-helix domain-containing protein n=1 Tax=Clostridioides difficile TaxID=1496 RepID=UPI001F1F97CD|nr:helix-turn-helix domain-containing protein [Clostridioides difficile]MCK1917603.1 helix-turn-helix domain-containing protein [Clostridioides difficile]MCP3278122.1 helix-turn-helix domain-containing protein [Clostridioides difficile]MCP8337736.1 helix-turn-helix domain-containing protein [Clostridioides difficile]MCP8368506.1 helix-turn-helix domain-containing protein [Clostridioides difficile]
MIILNKRLKTLRKELGLNQTQMGNKLFLSQDHISSLETGRRDLTDRIINDICKEFNVNENWLRTGEGDIFQDPTLDMDFDDDIKEMLRMISKLSPEAQKRLYNVAEVFLEEENRK